jgi:hypothetical protein
MSRLFRLSSLLRSHASRSSPLRARRTAPAAAAIDRVGRYAPLGARLRGRVRASVVLPFPVTKCSRHARMRRRQGDKSWMAAATRVRRRAVPRRAPVHRPCLSGSPSISFCLSSFSVFTRSREPPGRRAATTRRRRREPAAPRPTKPMKQVSCPPRAPAETRAFTRAEGGEVARPSVPGRPLSVPGQPPSRVALRAASPVKPFRGRLWRSGDPTSGFGIDPDGARGWSPAGHRDHSCTLRRGWSARTRWEWDSTP